MNTGKNLFRAAKTPATLFIVLVIDYVFQEIFQVWNESWNQSDPS